MGRIVHLHQPLGARGDIFLREFDYDNDDWNGGPAAMFFIWQDYGLLKKRGSVSYTHLTLPTTPYV